MDTKTHWEGIYTTRSPTQLSWYQAHAEISLAIIARTGVGKDAHIIDVGGGDSLLVDELFGQGFSNLTVLDISSIALRKARERLKERPSLVTWMEADITEVNLVPHSYDLWHDRAVFHFLTRHEHRQRYISRVKQVLKPGGHLVIATFAPDGPAKCSSLEIVRYSPEELSAEFGNGFQLIEDCSETHFTPSGAQQKFIYCWFRRRLP